MVHPLAVTPCNMDMEGLINDGNRSIATLAITTLLKTGSESGVERLMKQITSFMGEIADEFKIVVVDAIRGRSPFTPTHMYSYHIAPRPRWGELVIRLL